MPARTHPRPIRQTPVPHGTLIAGAFARVDYADAYRQHLQPGRFADVDAFARAILASPPGWVDALMGLRNRIVGRVGLKTGVFRTGQDFSQMTFRPGERSGIFRVWARTEDEILMGEDDHHLDFRVSLLLQRAADGDRVTVSTIVRYHNLLGRVYFLPVRPVHRLVVPAMMKRAARNGQRATGSV